MALIDHTQLGNLRELAAGDISFLVSVIDAFLPQLDEIPEALLRELEGGNPQRVAELAHSLKGSAGNVGAEDVQGLCLEIEKSARSGDLSEGKALIDRLRATAAATRQAFESEKRQLS